MRKIVARVGNFRWPDRGVDPSPRSAPRGSAGPPLPIFRGCDKFHGDFTFVNENPTQSPTNHVYSQCFFNEFHHVPQAIPTTPYDPRSGKPNNNSLQTESNRQPLRVLRGTQNPENLSNPRKYSHWNNQPFRNELLTTRSPMTMEALLESNKTIRETKEEKCECSIHLSRDETGKLPNTGPRANAARQYKARTVGAGTLAGPSPQRGDARSFRASPTK
jgi:hypothetical protein